MLNKLLVVLLIVTGFSLVSVTSVVADIAPYDPRQLINNAVAKLNPIVEEGHSYFEEDPDRLYANVNDLLETFFDFDAFARGVMGNHFSSVSKAQKANFTTILQRSLVRTFTKGMISLGAYSVNLLPPTAAKQQSTRASVTMQVTSADARHEMTYSLVRNENKSWRVRNLVFDGVNIGLSFRSQFANQASNSAGNIDEVINNWEISIDQ